MPWRCSLKSPPSDMCHSLLLCFLFLISFAETENSITERIWFCHSQMPSLQVVFGGGCRHFFPLDFSLFFLRDSVTVFVCGSPTAPRSSHAKEERHVFIKKKQRVGK